MRKPKAKTSSKSKATTQKSANKPVIAKPTLHPAQAEFFKTKAKYSAFVSGIGGGKSWVGAMRLLNQPPGSVSLVIAVSYKMLTTATQQTFWRAIEACGLKLDEVVIDHNKSEQVTYLSNGSVIHWRSADQPDLLRGLEVSACWLDEACYIKRDVFDIAIGRVRLPGTNQIWLTSSPNGKNWVYKLFCEENLNHPNYHLVKSTTKDNQFLPSSYYNDLVASYSSTQAAQELEAQFLDKGNARIKAEWIRKTNIIPKGLITMGVDLASSTKERADWTAATAVVNARGHQHVIASTRHKLPFHQSMQSLVEFAKKHRVRIIYAERTAYQASAIQELQRMLVGTGIAVKGVSPQGSKLFRFMPLEGRIEQGTITFSYDLPDEFFEELCDFSGDNKSWDDQVDSLVYAVEHEINRKGGGFFEIDN